MNKAWEQFGNNYHKSHLAKSEYQTITPKLCTLFRATSRAENGKPKQTVIDSKVNERFATASYTRDNFYHSISVNLSRFNVGTGHSQNRELEVGNKSPYDDLDTKMSGTRMSM